MTIHEIFAKKLLPSAEIQAVQLFLSSKIFACDPSVVIRAFRNLHFPAKVLDIASALDFFEGLNDLAFRVSGLFHLIFLVRTVYDGKL